MQTHVLRYSPAGVVMTLTAFVFAVAIFATTTYAYELTVNTAQAQTATTSTSTDENKILGDVTEQEFDVLLEEAVLVTERSLGIAAVFGSVIAIGPGASGQSVMLLEGENGSTTALSLSTKALIVRDDGTAAAVADLAPDQRVILAPQDALLSPATISGERDGALTVSKTNGTQVTLGTSSKAFLVYEGEPAQASAFSTGDSVVLVEREQSSGSSTVLAVIKPETPEPPQEEATSTTPTTTDETGQNSMFLWIVIGVAIIILILGYLLMRRGSSM